MSRGRKIVEWRKEGEERKAEFGRRKRRENRTLMGWEPKSGGEKAGDGQRAADHWGGQALNGPHGKG